MQVTYLLVLSLIGMGLVAALSAALYAALPRKVLECAELHGRFRGLQEHDEQSPSGTPSAEISRGTLSGQTA
jgi:hypothetical protein